MVDKLTTFPSTGEFGGFLVAINSIDWDGSGELMRSGMEPGAIFFSYFVCGF